MVPTGVILALALSGTARAQDDVAGASSRYFDAHDLFLAAYDGDLRDPLRVNRPGRLTQWDGWAGGVFEYANQALVHYDKLSDGTVVRTPWLDHVVALNLSAGVVFHERFRLDLAAPVYFASFDRSGDYQGVAFGDLRATAMIPLVIPKATEQGFGLAVYGHLDAPTGAEKKYLGESFLAGGGSVAASYAVGGFTWTGEAGAHFVPKVGLDNLAGADQFTGGLGLGYLVAKTTSLTVEGNFAVALAKNAGHALSESPMEVTLTLRNRQANGLNFLVGGAAGVSYGVGAPRARAFIGLGYGKIEAPKASDRDADGLLDTADRCPDDPETANGYKDDDGCPDALSSLAVQVLFDGKPVAGATVELLQRGAEEGETFRSTTDAHLTQGLMPGSTMYAEVNLGDCLIGDGSLAIGEGANTMDVTLRTVRSAFASYDLSGNQGRPVSGGVATWQPTSDALGCADPTYSLGTTGKYDHPVGPGTYNVFIEAPGYRVYRQQVEVEPQGRVVIKTQLAPTRVEVGVKELKILDKVYFDEGLASIKPESFELLNEIADTILVNKVGRVLIEGHTDDQGSDDVNLDVSDARANSVLEYLVARGVPEEQLLARGFGEARPIATNATAAGRAQNRRVVFTLLDKGRSQTDTQGGGQ